MSYDVIRSIETFSGEPITLMMYHGTTHDFETFSGERVNNDNMFGRQIYLTSSEYDAHQNYSSINGVDLENRILFRRDRLMDEHHDDEDYDEEIAEEEAISELYGKADCVLNVEVTIRNPLILGMNKPHSVTPQDDDLYHDASLRVAEDNDMSVDDLWESGDFEDLIYEEVDRLHMEAFDDFCALLNKALETLQSELDHDDAHQVLYQLFCNSETPEQIFETAVKDETYLYLFTDDTGMHNIKPVIAEIFHQHGHDCIVLLNAAEECRGMQMDSDTVHIAISVDHLSQLKITERLSLVEDSPSLSM